MKLQCEFKHIWFCINLLVFPFLILGCSTEGDWILNEKQITEAPQEMAMPVELFKKNIATTNYSALVYIKKARVLKKPIWPLIYFSDYLNHMYEAEVLETFKGPEHKEILFSVMAEANNDPFLPNYPIVLSLCGSIETGYYLPDNGYESAASDSLIDIGRSFKSRDNPFQSNQNACDQKASPNAASKDLTQGEALVAQAGKTPEATLRAYFHYKDRGDTKNLHTIVTQSSLSLLPAGN